MLNINTEVFMREFERRFYPQGNLREETRDGLTFLLSRIREDGLEFYGTVPAIAYTLATAGHESRKIVKAGAKRVVIQFVPVRETLAAHGTKLRAIQDRYSPWYGRGLIQVTWDYNYIKIGDYPGIRGYIVKHPTDATQDIAITGEVLKDNPDLMLDPGLSYLALAIGMRDGLYRPGHKLSTYFSAGHRDFHNARNIVNGNLDAAEDIAKAAAVYELILYKAINAPQPQPAPLSDQPEPKLIPEQAKPLDSPVASPVASPVDASPFDYGTPLSEHIDERAATGKTKIIPIAGGATVSRTAVQPTKLSGKVTAAIGVALTYLSSLLSKIVSLPPAILIALIIAIAIITASLVVMVIYIKDRREGRANDKDLAIMGQRTE